jgi:excisionase family DNA binding protein
MIAMLEKNWISVSDAAAMVGCTPQYLRKLAIEKEILCERVGHAWLLDKKTIEKMAANPPKVGRPRSRLK